MTQQQQIKQQVDEFCNQYDCIQDYKTSDTLVMIEIEAEKTMWIERLIRENLSNIMTEGQQQRPFYVQHNQTKNTVWIEI